MTDKEYTLCIRQHQQGVLQFAIRTCGDRELSKDVVQEALASMWEHRLAVEAEKGKSYLLSTVFRRINDHWRRKYPQGEIEEVTLPNEDFDIKEAIEMALGTLPTIQRSILQLKDVDGYSYKEIAEILSISDQQVCVYLYRARVALKKKLIEYGYNDR